MKTDNKLQQCHIEIEKRCFPIYTVYCDKDEAIELTPNDGTVQWGNP